MENNEISTKFRLKRTIQDNFQDANIEENVINITCKQAR